MRTSVSLLCLTTLLASGCSDDDGSGDFGPELGLDAADVVDSEPTPDAPADVADDVDVDGDPDIDVEDAEADAPDAETGGGEVGDAADAELEVAPTLGANPCSFIFSDLTGRGVEHSILLHNFGEVGLEVLGFELSESGQRAYSFEAPDLPFVVGPDTTQEVTLLFESGYPEAFGTTEWRVVYQLSGVELALVCNARQDRRPDGCDLIDVDLSVVGDPLARVGPSVGWAEPLDTIALRAGSLGDAIEELVWRLDSGPPQAARALTPDPEAPDNEFVRHYRLATPGSYRICAEAASVGGDFCRECPTISVTAPDGVWVELFWETADGTADLDLHGVFIGHPWFDESSDAWSGNPTDAWGAERTGLVGEATEDGPETLRLTSDCQWLAVGAHHAGGEGRAVPVLRVYTDGEFLSELAGPSLAPGEFWDAGRVHVDGARLLAVNEVIPEIEPGEVIPPATESMRLSGLCGS